MIDVENIGNIQEIRNHDHDDKLWRKHSSSPSAWTDTPYGKIKAHDHTEYPYSRGLIAIEESRAENDQGCRAQT